MSAPHPQSAAAALAVLDELKLRRRASAGCLAMIASIIEQHCRSEAVRPRIDVSETLASASVELDGTEVRLILGLASEDVADRLYAALAAAITSGEIAMALPRRSVPVQHEGGTA